MDQNTKDTQDTKAKIAILVAEIQDLSSCFSMAAEVCEKLTDENGTILKTQDLLVRGMVAAVSILKKQNAYMATLLHLIEMSNHTNFEWHCRDTISNLRQAISDTQAKLNLVLPDENTCQKQ